MKKYSKSKITQEAIDRAHFLKDKYPNMTNREIAENLYGGGYTHRVYSSATVAALLRVNSVKEYLSLPYMVHNGKKKPAEKEASETGFLADLLDAFRPDESQSENTPAPGQKNDEERIALIDSLCGMVNAILENQKLLLEEQRKTNRMISCMVELWEPDNHENNLKEVI